jgi:hypothetical protein
MALQDADQFAHSNVIADNCEPQAAGHSPSQTANVFDQSGVFENDFVHGLAHQRGDSDLLNAAHWDYPQLCNRLAPSEIAGMKRATPVINQRSE